MKLHFGAILPHTKMFGGVKRFFEIGNLLIEKGHSFTVFTPEGHKPTWFIFNGHCDSLDHLNNYTLHALFITEPEFLTHLKNSKAQIKIFYAVLERPYIKKVVRDKDIYVFANATKLYNYLGGSSCANLFKAIGGIDPEKFNYNEAPRNTPFCILAYGRFYRKKKGVQHVVKACEWLFRRGYNIHLLLFDSPVDEHSRELVRKFSCQVPHTFFVDYPVEQLHDLYCKADVFVSAERNAGWSNTTAEAMSSGVAVIATRSGTIDFLMNNITGLVVWRHWWFIQRAILKLYKHEELRLKLRANARKKIEEYSWSSLSMTIETFVLNKIQTK